MNTERYARQIMLSDIGIEGQRKLANTSVLIIGIGGLGTPVVQYLTGAGIGRIGLADNDVVSESNLHRQVLYSEAHIGLPKVEIARRRVLELSSSTTVECFPEGLTEDNANKLISDYDIVIDCSDNYATRYLIDETCIQFSKPWVHGAIGAYIGQVTLFNHKFKKRYTDLYPDRAALCAQPKTSAGVLGTVPAVVGAIQANEAIKWALNIGELLDGKLFRIDLLTLNSNIFDF